jgi:hypothetical protein
MGIPEMHGWVFAALIHLSKIFTTPRCELSGCRGKGNQPQDPGLKKFSTEFLPEL